MTDHVDVVPTIAARLAALEAREAQTREALRLLAEYALTNLNANAVERREVLAALDAPAPDAGGEG